MHQPPTRGCSAPDARCHDTRRPDRSPAGPPLLPAPGRPPARRRDAHLLDRADRSVCVQDQETGQSWISGLRHPGGTTVLLRGGTAPEPAARRRPVSGSRCHHRQQRVSENGRAGTGTRIRGENAAVPGGRSARSRAGARRTASRAYRRARTADRVISPVLRTHPRGATLGSPENILQPARQNFEQALELARRPGRSGAPGAPAGMERIDGAAPCRRRLETGSATGSCASATGICTSETCSSRTKPSGSSTASSSMPTCAGSTS